MRKNIIMSLATVLACGTAMAGGLNTNTNVNAHFLRFFTQDANVTLTALHANPAGSAFLTKGWHFSIHNQSAIQQRNVTTTFPLFVYNPKNYGSDTHRYEGRAFAPVIPAIGFSYNSGKKWSINGQLALVGGGGACEFEQGIGSFEALYAGNLYANVAPAYIGAVVPQLMAAGMDQASATARARQMFSDNYRFSNTAYMKGSNYMFGLQVGATYKVLDNLAVFAGIRGVYATGNYNGYVQDVMYSTDGGNNYTYATQSGTQELAGQTVNVNGRNTTLSMNCDQTGFGVTPILGIHWAINKHWNLAAKYEFKTKIRMKNTTDMNEYTQTLVDPSNPNYSHTLAAYADGKKVADDIPGYLAIGTQYSPKENIRIGFAYHWMQDGSANKGTAEITNPDGSKSIVDKRELIDHDTHEVLAGVEWKCHERLTISGSWQKTMYGVKDQYMNDISFCCSSNSLGCGMRIHASRLFNIDLGYMHTFYQDRTVVTPTAVGPKTDTYNRHNDVIGVGLNFAW